MGQSPYRAYIETGFFIKCSIEHLPTVSFLVTLIKIASRTAPTDIYARVNVSGPY